MQSEDFAVIGHTIDLPYCIHAVVCNNSLPHFLPLHNFCGDGAQFTRLHCTTCAVVMLGLGRDIQYTYPSHIFLNQIKNPNQLLYWKTINLDTWFKEWLKTLIYAFYLKRSRMPQICSILFCYWTIIYPFTEKIVNIYCIFEVGVWVMLNTISNIFIVEITNILSAPILCHEQTVK